MSVDVGTAYWTQRHLIAADAARIRSLAKIVDATSSLSLPQWAMLMSVMGEFKPDLVIELGRGNGNSTCAFAETAALTGLDTRILSVCTSRAWNRTRRGIAPLVDAAWLDRLDIRTGNIVGFPFEREIGAASRVLVFWDAHGFEVASTVLTSILPALMGREHMVIMHDISDARYSPRDSAYRSPIWAGEHADGHYFRLGHVESSVGQAISILDFATRNELPLHTADESIDSAIVKQGRGTKMQETLGDLYSPRGHFTYFNLSEARRPLPLTIPPPLLSNRIHLAARMKRALLVLLGRA